MASRLSTSCSYAFGDVAEEYFEQNTEEPKLKLKVVESYEPGDTYQKMLSDVREMFFVGYDEEDIVEFIDEKQHICRNVGGLRSVRDIRQIVTNWSNKFDGQNFFRHKKPIVDMADVLDKIRGDGLC